MEKLSYTIKEATDATGLSRSRLYELIKAGAIMPRKIGSRTLILKADLLVLLEALPTSYLSVGTDNASTALNRE